MVFKEVDANALPPEKRQQYNVKRQSKILVLAM
ncbi:N-acetylglutamate synthase-like GNAT family acetyltransferase [Endozoicomonas sp. NE40]|uniref:N-acetylglutamate synthase-like GNAT family acetyltransferase n=1 Tax=Endozoicomonas lisbonensis TaxID=3120522 RepID=A0ABV2SG75_9GAMM